MEGSYALVLKNSRDTDLVIGSLGEKHLEKGTYIYVGSAFGENQSISARVNRHVELSFSGKGSVHWHIDYLLVSSEFQLIGFNKFFSKHRNECKVAREIREKSDGEIENFGCSDCGCSSHLFYQGD